jgi:type IV pilus assembly protein PilB
MSRSTTSTSRRTTAKNFELLDDNEEIDLATLTRASEDAPVVRLVNVLMVDSLRRGASDIHVEPYEKDFRIRFRIDGVLYDVMHPPMKLRDPLISRLKIMAKLDISEKRLPQDGRIKIKVKVDDRSRELDFRVSTLPTLFGEKVVLRLLDKDKLMLDMTKARFRSAESREIPAGDIEPVRHGPRYRPRPVRVKRTRFIRRFNRSISLRRT